MSVVAVEPFSIGDVSDLFESKYFGVISKANLKPDKIIDASVVSAHKSS